MGGWGGGDRGGRGESVLVLAGRYLRGGVKPVAGVSTRQACRASCHIQAVHIPECFVRGKRFACGRRFFYRMEGG